MAALGSLTATPEPPGLEPAGATLGVSSRLGLEVMGLRLPKGRADAAEALAAPVVPLAAAAAAAAAIGLAVPASLLAAVAPLLLLGLPTEEPPKAAAKAATPPARALPLLVTELRLARKGEKAMGALSAATEEADTTVLRAV